MRSHSEVDAPRTWRRAVAIYRLALRIYPSVFRTSFGPDLEYDFQAATDEGWRGARWRGVAVVWTRIVIDLVVSAVKEWTRAGWPVATLFVTPVALAALGVSWRVYRGAWSRAHLQGEDDVALVLVAVSTVLLVLVCTLVFTTMLMRPRAGVRR